MVPAIDKARNPCNLRDLSVFYMENIGYNEAKKKREEDIDCLNEGNKRRLCLLIYYFSSFFLVYQIIKRRKTEKFCV